MGLEIIQELKKEKGLTIEELSAKSGVPIGTLNKILSGQTKDPKLETLKALTRVLGCSLDDLDDADRKTGRSYYLDPDTAEFAQQYFDNPNMRVLFNAARNATPEGIRLAAEMLQQMKKTNPDG